MKYIIAKTGEPINIGDTLHGEYEEVTTFGVIKTTKDILVTEDVIPNLIDRGIIQTVVTKKNINENYNISKIIGLLAEKYDKSVNEVIDWLEHTNKICPKAVLDILLQEVAYRFYIDDEKAFNDAHVYYSLRPKDGKVGKVQNINNYIPLFKSIEDAEKAREILKKQLDYMYGEATC